MLGSVTCIACDPGIDLAVFDSDFLQVRIATPGDLRVNPISILVVNETLMISLGGKYSETKLPSVRFPGDVTSSREMGSIMISVGFPGATKARLQNRERWSVQQRLAPANDGDWTQ